MTGSGTTASQRFLACQTALHGARFAICDPHAGAADDSLAATAKIYAHSFAENRRKAVASGAQRLRQTGSDQ